jgi:hypothetical protein
MVVAESLNCQVATARLGMTTWSWKQHLDCTTFELMSDSWLSQLKNEVKGKYD